ncbi:MAG: cytochrome P450 [Rhodospirillaceae bacterium]|jgi:cytochrome P450|nr:cytochrome P450 [Rhodospirillaceae bacterium]MBT5895783.1 cytochrome P450 [Rhodospirillaceae bacterium]MBT6428548.1 cytochrome P450 [Rhodospirillaceae bacterium]
MSTAEPTIQVNPDDIAGMADAVPILCRLQDEDPVHWSPDGKAWMITRYDDVRAGFHDRRLGVSRPMPPAELFEPEFRDTYRAYASSLKTWMVIAEPPDHPRLRKLANRGLTPTAIEGLRPQIAELVDDLLAAMPDTGDVDFVKAFAYPLPASVIALLIGVPKSVLKDLHRWSDDIAKGLGAAGEDIIRPPAYAAAEMTAYLTEFIAERRKNPQDAIIDLLIAARDDDDTVTTEELIGNLILFLFAGHETTMNLLSNGLRTLIRHPEQMADLRRNLDDPEVVAGAVEEILRYDGALFMLTRFAAEDFEWHGRRISKGQKVYLYCLAANHDVRKFDDPGRFDIRRTDSKQHLAFGYGPHFCLGGPLARLEMEVALPPLLRRYAALSLPAGDVPWRNNMTLRGQPSMQLRLSKGVRT